MLLAARRLAKARGEVRGTQFELERDMARYRQSNAVTTLILLVEMALIVFGVQRVVAPTLRNSATGDQLPIDAVQDLTFIPPTQPPITPFQPDISGVQIGATDPSQRIVSTPTLTPTPVGTIRPNAPPIRGCDVPGVNLQVPANGMVVFEPMRVIGVATVENFSAFKFEINGPSTLGNFAPIQTYTQPVPEMGELGQFVPSFYEPGEYQFRLSVFDITGAMKASCTVTIYITEPIPTATPLS